MMLLILLTSRMIVKKAKDWDKTNKEEVIEPIDDELKKKILNLYTDSKKKILFK